MVETEESRFKLSDGKELYMKKWIPTSTPVAKLLFVHGFSDHCNRYYELFPTLAGRGILVIGYDQRGFGRSTSKRSDIGLTGPTFQVLADLVEVIRFALPSDVPLFVMGHSMGGGEVLTLASTPEYEDLMPHIRGFLLEAPFIALSHKANPFTLIAGRLAGRLLPHFQIKQPIPPKDLSRDQEVVKSLEEDPYCDGTGTLEMFANMLDRASGLEKGLLKLNKGVQALWLSHGTKDLACSYAASKEWFERQDTVVDKTFKTYDGWYHQLHADLPEDRPVYAKDVGDWILERVGGTSAYDAAQAVPPHEFVKEGLTSSDDAGTSASVPSKENHSKL